MKKYMKIIAWALAGLLLLIGFVVLYGALNKFFAFGLGLLIGAIAMYCAIAAHAVHAINGIDSVK